MLENSLILLSPFCYLSWGDAQAGSALRRTVQHATGPTFGDRPAAFELKVRCSESGLLICARVPISKYILGHSNFGNQSKGV